MPIDESVRFPNHYLTTPIFPVDSEDLQLCRTTYHSITDDISVLGPLSSQGFHMLEPPSIVSIQTPHELILRASNDAQAVDEVEPSPFQPTAFNSAHCGFLTPTACPLLNADQSAIHKNSHIPVDPSSPSWSTYFDREYFLPLVQQENCTRFQQPVLRPSIYPSSACSSAVASFPSSYLSTNKKTTESFIPPHFPSYQPFTSMGPNTMSHEFTKASPCSSLYCGSRHEGTGSSRCARSARAIEYNGLWIDEEELLKSLINSGGELNIHQCLWEHGSSPCHIWIKSDKSCIHAHLQKWHGEAPGGDKTLVQCRWPGCGKTMRKESIARHILSIHLDETWECQGCGKSTARHDAYEQHVRRSDFEECRTSGALVTYAVEMRVINARVALDGHGRIRYAGRDAD